MRAAAKAVILLSGGLDSATTLAIARQAGFELYTISFRYGQRHAIELAAAHQIADRMGVKRHIVVDIDLRQFGGSALTANLDVPKHDRVEEIGTQIPITYVPARNTVFLSLALAYSETLGAGDIFIGVNALDYSGYPDCRPEFVQAFERMANLGTKAGVEAAARGESWFRVHGPLQTMTKAQIVRLGAQLQVDFGMTSSCYDPAPDGRPCGHCDACLLRARGFAEAGTRDPVTR